MPKFKTRFEASAAIIIEFEIEAEDGYDAEDQAQRRFESYEMEQIVDHLCYPSQWAVKGYAEERGKNEGKPFPLTHVGVETDESGFDFIEAEEVAEEVKGG